MDQEVKKNIKNIREISRFECKTILNPSISPLYDTKTVYKERIHENSDYDYYYPGSNVMKYVFLTNDTFAAISQYSNNVFIIDFECRKCVKILKTDTPDGHDSVECVCKVNESVIATINGLKVIFWDVSKEKEIKIAQINVRSWNSEVFDDERIIICGSVKKPKYGYEKAMFIINYKEKKIEKTIIMKYQDIILHDSKFKVKDMGRRIFISTCYKGNIAMWKINKFGEEKLLKYNNKGHTTWISAVIKIEDDKFITTCYNFIVVIWDFQLNMLNHIKPHINISNAIYSAFYSKNSGIFYFGTMSDLIIFNLKTKKHLLTIENEKQRIYGVHEDNGRLVTVSDNGCVKFYDTSMFMKGKCLKKNMYDYQCQKIFVDTIIKTYQE